MEEQLVSQQQQTDAAVSRVAAQQTELTQMAVFGVAQIDSWCERTSAQNAALSASIASEAQVWMGELAALQSSSTELKTQVAVPMRAHSQAQHQAVVTHCQQVLQSEQTEFAALAENVETELNTQRVSAGDFVRSHLLRIETLDQRIGELHSVWDSNLTQQHADRLVFETKQADGLTDARQQLEQFVQRDLRVDIPTGQTPIKREIAVLPVNKLIAVPDSDRLLTEFRDAKNSGGSLLPLSNVDEESSPAVSQTCTEADKENSSLDLNATASNSSSSKDVAAVAAGSAPVKTFMRAPTSFKIDTEDHSPAIVPVMVTPAASSVSAVAAKGRTLRNPSRTLADATNLSR